VAENLQPKHFVQWTRLAYNSDPAEPFGNFSGLIPWQAPTGPVPPYPYASNMADPGAPVGDPMGAGGGGMGPETSTTGSGLQAQDLVGLREEIRRLVIEELSQLVGGERRG
jgi:acetaldehyde dehydrogenase/alcohol dehydrogenase